MHFVSCPADFCINETFYINLIAHKNFLRDFFFVFFLILNWLANGKILDFVFFSKLLESFCRKWFDWRPISESLSDPSIFCSIESSRRVCVLLIFNPIFFFKKKILHEINLIRFLFVFFLSARKLFCRNENLKEIFSLKSFKWD